MCAPVIWRVARPAEATLASRLHIFLFHAKTKPMFGSMSATPVEHLASYIMGPPIGQSLLPNHRLELITLHEDQGSKPTRACISCSFRSFLPPTSFIMSKTLSLLALAAAAGAVDFGQWSPAGPGDSRGPCPGLNTMANHGIIPHDGKGLSVPVLKQGMADAYNVAADVAIVLSIGGLGASPNPLGLTLDLADLDKHNFIEHDGSLSRADFGEGGDDHTFNPDIFHAFMSGFAGLDNTTTESAAKAKFARVQNESKSDPDFTYGVKQFVLSYAESALYIKALGNDGDSVPLSWLQTFFEDEKLPYDQGWRPTANPIGFVNVITYIPQLIAAAGDEVPEGLIIGNNTVARALLGLDVLGNDVSSFVQNLLNQFGLGGLL
jgi:Peroxidase, family 2